MASVKLILLEDVDSLGLAGDEVTVSAGYARNYLLPKDKAAKASPATLRRLAKRKEEIERRRREELEKAKSLAQKIAEADISIPMEANDEDHLYGSVTERMISDAFKEQGLEVDYHAIKLEQPIKTLGLFNVPVKLHNDVTVTAKVWVVRA